ncbi:DUF397 domain-containing protein [Streptomyces sp. PT12]|uniref:DUF397 domain-containing protein n=1 Tax=Streptomyces sp. PT12 TaxID=1510197 RepID=UPI000DE21BCD|nr:DUF397 domain-containing protein [Streptomyces sp. PT12]RBM04534.1 hypothetical protein DEH69_30695 [Streptomyces sp. PT12]
MKPTTPITWHKSSYSGNDNGCIERGRLGAGRQAIRDSEDPGRGVLFLLGWDRAALGLGRTALQAHLGIPL